MLTLKKLDGLLSELLTYKFNDKIILSCLFQVSYGLAYLQKQGFDCGGIDIDKSMQDYVDVVNQINNTDVEVIYMDFRRSG